MTAFGELRAAQPQQELRRGAIGLREVLFQSITDMAPGAAIAASIPAGAAFAGGSLPLSVIFALVACLLCAWCIGELARELPSAGSLATYSARGLHPSVGFLVAWGYAMVGALIPPLVLLQLGFTVAGTLHGQWSAYPAGLWWPWSILGVAIIFAAGFYGIRASTRLGTVLGAFEIAVFLVLALMFIVRAGAHNTGSVFGTGLTPKSYRGLSGVFAGSVYTILAFGGFEGAAPLAEEARNPRRVVRQAVLGATLGIGLIYVLTTYAAAVTFGPGHFVAFTTAGPSSWVGLARTIYGLFWVLVFLAIVNSTVANANAGVNVASRTAYAMGRVGAFPSLFSIVHPRHRSPWIGVALTSLFTLAITLGLGFAYGPTTAFAMVGAGIVIILVSVYILADAACIGFFARRGGGFRLLSHLVVPVLGIAAFVPAWLTAVGIPAFSFITPLTPPLSYMAFGIGGWILLGVAWLAVLYARSPESVVRVGVVHLDLEPAVDAPAGVS
jgi:amino acid transporter